MRVVAAVAADREGRTTNEDEDVEAGGKMQEKEEEEEEEKRRRCKSNATFGGMKRRSVAVDVEGRRGDRAEEEGKGVGRKRHGGKQKPDFNTPSHPYGITSLAEYNQDL